MYSFSSNFGPLWPPLDQGLTRILLSAPSRLACLPGPTTCNQRHSWQALLQKLSLDGLLAPCVGRVASLSHRRLAVRQLTRLLPDLASFPLTSSNEYVTVCRAIQFFPLCQT